MRNLRILVVLILSVAIYSSCEKDYNTDNTNGDNSVKGKLKNNTSKTNSDIQMVRYDNFVLFFDKPDDEIYFLQIESDASEINVPNQFASNAYLNDDGKILIVEQAEGNLEYTFIEDEIIGIGQINYQSGIDNEIIIENNGEMILHPFDSDYIPEIKCKCFGSGNTLPSNCTAGGQGASSCSVSSSGGGGCSVSCPYEIPCCTVDNNFT